MSSDEDGSCLPEDPAITKPLFATNDVVSDLSTDIFPPVLELRQNKTRRQLESLEARLRIFGDCYGVEIPTGYSAISTRSGVRLVEGKAGLQQIVSDRICLPRGRSNSSNLIFCGRFESHVYEISSSIVTGKLQLRRLMSFPVEVEKLFFLHRVPTTYTIMMLLIYLPIGCAVFLIRLFIGLHTVIVASLLRKSTMVRCVVLRVMCSVLGILVRTEGERNPKTGVICANHVSVLDDVAVELVEPCVFSSTWSIPLWSGGGSATLTLVHALGTTSLYVVLAST
ncbi:hypothetical protein KIN20_022037 [Parelaphostrongylus tenuis]|uniref:Phospholipid/glycerol acyltransferase domain-containing protein n=1 Tax=Parelaphostrongylus tenuis TaxID=148309 RepID=A0AAD5QUI9_PARTN|nr:hypothetical protein KIN20_022037 [Parelaphostrongylus tenuis]